MFDELFKRLDLSNEHFKKTPERAIKWFKAYTTYIPVDVICKKYCVTFNLDKPTDTVVTVTFNQVFMLCPHHLLPVEMKIRVDYVPSDKILGLSKFKRMAEALARYPRTQEEYTDLLGKLYVKCLNPKFLSLTVVGRHMCVLMRGVKSNSIMTTEYNYTSEDYPNDKS